MPELIWKGKELIQESIPESKSLGPDIDRLLPNVLNGNVVIEGDNLPVLHLLNRALANQVHFVFLDPPYNTGVTSWIYDDSAKNLRLPNESVIDRNVSNMHDRWLCMIYPRLREIHDLLHEAGVIAVSINDSELAHLRLVMDELYGQDNFLAQWSWCDSIQESLSSPELSVSVCRSYTVVYARSRPALLRKEGNRLTFLEIFRHNFRSHRARFDHLSDIFGSSVFPFPKDPTLVAQMIDLFTAGYKDCVVLDPFGGSGTTGHAVLQLNAKDGGNRRFILIEAEPSIAEPITVERIRRVADGYLDPAGISVPGLGGDFTFFRLGDKSNAADNP